MERIIRSVVCGIAIACAGPIAARAEVAVSATIAVGAPVETATFHERLAPFGRWEHSPAYGEVWVPAGVRAGWRPYSDGRWVLTEHGWTFVSDDPWGWAAWHYGNWALTDAGWVWVPGRVWAPAWVSWRYGGGYACWAPAPPLRYGVAVYGYGSPAWVVVRQEHFTQPIATVVVSPSVAVNYVQRARPLAQPVVAGGVGVNPGPQPHAVAVATGHPVTPVAASAVVGHGTAAIAKAPPAPAAPRAVASAMAERGWRPAAPVQRQQNQIARHQQNAQARQQGQQQRQERQQQRRMQQGSPARAAHPAKKGRGRGRGR